MTRGVDGMRGDFDALAAAQLADRFEDLGSIEVENEVDLFAVLNQVVAFGRLTRFGFIQGQALAVPQQEGLQVACGRDFKGRTAGS